MSNRISLVIADPMRANYYKAPLESITPLHYYTTMGFSHCSSSSSSRDNIAMRAPKDAAARSIFPLVHPCLPTALCPTTAKRLLPLHTDLISKPQSKGGDNKCKITPMT
jgi:hypothetical protein